MTEPTAVVSLTRRQLNTLLTALADKELDVNRYLVSYKDLSDTPTAEDECCATHQQRYERDMEKKRALLAEKEYLKNFADDLDEALAAIDASDD